MWPWEHLAFGYIIYSSAIRLLSRRTPSDGSAIALVIGTLFPDLVDKPLAWAFNVLPYGRSLGHSIFTTAAVCALGLVWGRRSGGSRPAIAFCVGYLSHLAGDVLYPVLTGSSPDVAFMIWPLSERPPQPTGFFLNVQYFVRAFLSFLETPMGVIYIFFELLLVGTALVLWRRDGAPGWRVLGHLFSGVLSNTRR